MRNISKDVNRVDKIIETEYKYVGKLYTWKFYGNGFADGWDGAFCKYKTTFPEFLDWCELKRKTDGTLWNGMIWREDTGLCNCFKNERVFKANVHFVHYKVVE